MTATAAVNGACVPSGAVSPFPAIESAPLAASAQAGRGQILTYDSSGNASLNGGATANVTSAGIAYPSTFSNTSTVAGAAAVNVAVGVVEVPMSSASLDSFSASDVIAPAFVYDENTIGKKSNTSYVKRAIFGLVRGITSASETTPRAKAIGGPIASLLARALLFLNSAPLASYQIADSGASSATTERIMSSAAVVGQVTSVEYIGAALAASNTDYATVTIKKYGASDSYASGATVATYDTRSANNGAAAALTPAAFTLSGTAANLSVLETDVFTITVTKTNSGQQLVGAIRVNGKVI